MKNILGMNKKLIALTFFFIIVGLLLWPAAAFAQTQLPAATECKAASECKVGSYIVRVTFDRDNFNTVDPVLVTVERLDKAGGDWQLEAQVIPAPRTSAVPVKFSGDLATSDPLKRQVKIDFPISGNWYLYLNLKGAAGTVPLRIAARVESPPRMPEWLAWVIGLSPLVGIAGFAIGQWRHVRRRKREERLALQVTEETDQPEVISQKSI